MAYDPNDPADKKLVEGLVAAALTEQQTEHEASIAGLKTKNAELIAAMKKSGGDGEAVARLEGELDTNKEALKAAQRELRKITGERDTMAKNLEAEGKITHSLLVDGGLTEALVKANVAPAFMPAVKALLASQVSIKTEGDSRKAVVGEKSLGDFIAEWSQGDQGKHYVAAPVNGGGGGNGGTGKAQSGKTMTRADYEANPGAAAKFFADGGTLTD